MTQRARFSVLSMAIYAVSLVCVAAASWVTGPSFAELDRIDAVRDAQGLVVAISEHGVSALLEKSAGKVYRTLSPHGTGLGLVAAWLSLLAEEWGVGDVLTGLRAPYLLLIASAPVSLFWGASRALGLPVGLLSAAMLLCQSWFLHEAAVASVDAVVGSAWLLVLACHVRALVVPSGGRRVPVVGWAVCTCLALGFGLSATLATLWVVPVILAHTLVVHRRLVPRALRHGAVPVPGATVLALGITPAVFVGCSPEIWRGSPSHLVRTLLRPLAEPSAEVGYLGEAVSGPPYPALYPAHWMAGQLSAVVLALALAGTLFWARARWRRDLEDRVATGALVALIVGAGLAGTSVVPPPLASFPPRLFAAMACVAIPAAVCLQRALARVPLRLRAPVLVAFGAVLAGVSVWDLPTRGAGFGLLVGGTRAVRDREIFASDGSDLAVVASIAAEQGVGQVNVGGAPARYGAALRSVGRDRGVTWASRGRGGEADVVRGADERALARVQHRGAVLWSLVPR